MEADFVRFRSRRRVRYILFLVALFGVLMLSQALLNADFIMRVAYATQCVVDAVGFGALVLLVARARPQSLAAEVAVAKRFELITVVVCAILSTVTALVATHDARVRCESGGFGNAGAGWRCFYNGVNIVVIVLVIVSTLARPRLAYIVPLVVSAVVAFFIGAIVDSGYTATDYAAIAVILIVCGTATCLEAYADEILKRRNFLDHVRLVRAEVRMAAMAGHMKEILSSAMPPELLNDDMTLAARTHRSDCATVGISDIYDFAQWSCGLLVFEVMSILDTLLTVCDMGAAEQGVVRAMTYGDSYVVCAGLVSACAEHTEKVLAFERWYIRVAARVTEQRDTAFRVRTSVCTGPVVGAVTGGASVRYVLAGPAFDGAVAGLQRCLSTAPSVIKLVSVASPSLPLTAALRENPASREEDGVAKTVESVVLESHQSSQTDPFAFSCFLLAFDSPEVQNRLAEFLKASEAANGPMMAALPAVVFAAFLAAVLIEYASSDERRHHPPLPTAGIAVASIVSGVAAALRWKHAPVPLSVLYGMTIGSIALGMVSLFFAECVFAAPRTMVMYLLAVPALFLRMPWLAQTAVQLTVVVVPSMVWVAREYGLGSGVYLMILTPLIVFFSVRYISARALCEQFVAATLTEHALLVAFDRSVEHDKLLAGVLPPHAIRRDGMLVTTASELGTNAMEQWANLSTLQVAMRGITGDAGPALPAVCTVWPDVQTCVAETGEGLLEMVQATGDTFLIAGPFNRVNDGITANDERQVAATRRVIAVVRALCDLLADRCVFKGVAACGTASGALLGASLLSFRLFGPVVRESTALLAAAPTADVPVAFSSSSFRQQHQNFVAPAAPRGMSRHMSAAALLSLRGELPLGGDEDDGDVISASSDVTSSGSPFGDAAQWRVRGVGVASVSVIRL
jgi:class 3 adenylate cyclase